MYLIFKDHQLVAEHPPGTIGVADVNTGDLVVSRPGTTFLKTYAAGTWHAAGDDIVCGFKDPAPATGPDACPRCHIP